MEFESFIDGCLELIELGIDASIKIIDGEPTYLRPVEVEDCYIAMPIGGDDPKEALKIMSMYAEKLTGLCL